MIHGRKVIVVMPAYNAERTLKQTFEELPKEIVDEVILTDDGSKDRTAEVSEELGITTYRHIQNRGYGGNQKTCYQKALEKGADIVVMVHPDYQYTPFLVTAMASMVGSGLYDVVLASRILGNTALSGGMPLYKYTANRALTFFQNLMLGQKVSEYHTGYRAFSRKVLETLPLEENSEDFIFDNQMLTQTVYFGFQIGEVSCPTKYFEEASSINFKRSVVYGLGCVLNSVYYALAKRGVYSPRFLKTTGQRLLMRPLDK